MTSVAPRTARRDRPARSPLLPAMVGVLLFGCSSSGTGVSKGTGGTSSVVGSGGAPGPGSGGASTTAVLGGTMGAGGVGAGGGNATGGATASGGAVGVGGSRGAGGTTGAGGAANTGGVPASGGATDSGGSTGAGGVAATGGNKATGGAIATGGISATGGATAAGGNTGTAGATSDRCDVGVYDAANPPQVLSLTGNLGAHNPAAIESNGAYYLYYTGLAAKTSTNLTAWSAAPSPLSTPAWMTAAIPGLSNLWAPDVSYFGGTYHLYYAGSTFGKNTSCIGHATRASLSTGSWTDQGSATICSNVGTTDNWNAIDPNAVLDTEGNPWLVFGSFWSGIKIIQLDQTGARVGTTVTAIASRPSNGGALEGSFMVRRCGYYYLFTSWDTCCNGASSTYNMRVVRGTSVTGPFADMAGTAALQGGGTLIAQTGGNWAGPGGQSVMFVGTKAYLVYHAYAMSNGAATLRIADLVWDSNGWPVPVGP